MPHPIVLFHPYIPPGTKEAVSRVLDTRWIGQGPVVEEFEKRFSERMCGRASLAVGSCTDALHLAYILAGIKPGDEVVAPVFTCTATNEALMYAGARIRFADCEKNSLNIDPVHVAQLVATHDRVKAIVVVHYGGQPAHMAPLRAIAQARGIPIIGDCAQALGGMIAGFPIGMATEYSCFSFQAIKHVTTGDGGMLVLHNEEQVERAKRLRWFGIDRAAKLGGIWENDIVELGYKYQMTDVAAAMGIMGLETLVDQMLHRRILRWEYAMGLGDVPGISVMDRDEGSAIWLMTVLADRREDLRRKLKDAQIESDQVHYRNDRYSIFREFLPKDGAGDFTRREQWPNMDAIDSKYLCLPLHMKMGQEDVARVCDVIRSGW